MYKKIKFGAIGYGFMGSTHVSNIIKHPKAEIVSIYTQPDKEISLPNVKIFSDDWKELIDNSDIDAIIIATPTHTHAEIAKYAAKSGKHVFLEKPMARTVKESQEIIDICKKNNVKLFLAHVLRYFQSYTEAYNQINNQAGSLVGDVKMIRALRYSTLPSWSNWFFDEEKSGGCILDLNIHDIDYAIWMMGTLPQEIYCEARKLPEKDINTYAMAMTTLKFNKGIAHLEASWLGTEKFQWFSSAEIIGDKGIIKFDSKSAIPLNFYGKNTHQPHDLYHEDAYYLEMNAFISSILNDTEPEVSGLQGKYAVAVCIAALKSAKEERPVKLSEVL